VEEIQHASFDRAGENVLTARAEPNRHGATRGVSSQLGPEGLYRPRGGQGTDMRSMSGSLRKFKKQVGEREKMSGS
jgi:hypothetical protein